MKTLFVVLSCVIWAFDIIGNIWLFFADRELFVGSIVASVILAIILWMATYI